MGLNLWMVAGGAAWALARFIPPGRSGGAEAVTAFVAANLAGIAATALDFGGWNELDWRAALFVFFCVAAALAIVRVVRLSATGAAS